MLGGVPLTAWLPEEVERDRGGYLLTGLDLVKDGRVVECWPLDRPPQVLETSMPRVFAAGDVRHGSSNRVASAVGDGSVVIAQIHRLMDDPRPTTESPEEGSRPSVACSSAYLTVWTFSRPSSKWGLPPSRSVSGQKKMYCPGFFRSSDAV